jgi:hypothetical protein
LALFLVGITIIAVRERRQSRARVAESPPGSTTAGGVERRARWGSQDLAGEGHPPAQPADARSVINPYIGVHGRSRRFMKRFTAPGAVGSLCGRKLNAPISSGRSWGAGVTDHRRRVPLQCD